MLLVRILLVKISFCYVVWSLGNSLTQKNCVAIRRRSIGHIFCVREFPRELSSRQEEIMINEILANSRETSGHHLVWASEGSVSHDTWLWACYVMSYRLLGYSLKRAPKVLMALRAMTGRIHVLTSLLTSRLCSQLQALQDLPTSP